MKAEAIVGTNYGDEGKGLLTDFICSSRPNSIVIMTNGGSQRGHTVELKDGTRHVFHHFGAGSLRGIATYFPKSYMLNPMQFVKEHRELVALEHAPLSWHDKRCVIQLPCDIALNWHLEKSRGDNKHGSVGCGIWETKCRTYGNDACTLDEFCALSLKDKIELIHRLAKKYRDRRCVEEGVSRHADIYDLFMSKGFIDHFIADCIEMNALCPARSLKDIVNDDCTLVFENGQGLMLDQFYGASDESNTTPSFTGSIGIANLINEYDLEVSDLTMNYVSRTYLTKHGAGNFKEESKDFNFKFDDVTNVDNEWQDELRFAPLDMNEMLKRCDHDFDMLKKFISGNVNVKKSIAFTHANEVPVQKKFASHVDFISVTKFSDDIFRMNKK